jgi:hypothetical protein
MKTLFAAGLAVSALAAAGAAAAGPCGCPVAHPIHHGVVYHHEARFERRPIAAAYAPRPVVAYAPVYYGATYAPGAYYGGPYDVGVVGAAYYHGAYYRYPGYRGYGWGYGVHEREWGWRGGDHDGWRGHDGWRDGGRGFAHPDGREHAEHDGHDGRGR